MLHDAVANRANRSIRAPRIIDLSLGVRPRNTLGLVRLALAHATHAAPFGAGEIRAVEPRTGEIRVDESRLARIGPREIRR
ncbi:MAG: hypothetical protein WCF44_14430 [Candidatus Methylophosphatis roskildensis]